MKEIRTCVVCFKKDNKKQMNRIYINQKSIVEIDAKQKMQVRGRYICSDANCHSKLLNRKLLNRVFRKQISQENYEAIIAELKIQR